MLGEQHQGTFLVALQLFAVSTPSASVAEIARRAALHLVRAAAPHQVVGGAAAAEVVAAALAPDQVPSAEAEQRIARRRRR